MAKAPDKTGEGRSAEAADFGRLADALKDMPAVPLHPLMAHPTAALAAATAIGFGLATHMTSVFLGSLHGAIEATNRLARQLEDEQAKTDTEVGPVPAEAGPNEPVSAADRVKPRKAGQPRPATVKATKPVASKPGAAKLTAAKPKMVKPAVAQTTAAIATAEAPARSAVAKAAKPARSNGRADDLKKIEGIGPKLEQILNGRGIRRFADLVALDAGGLEALDKAIGLGGRALRDDWLGQARNLARGKK